MQSEKGINKQIKKSSFKKKQKNTGSVTTMATVAHTTCTLKTVW